MKDHALFSDSRDRKSPFQGSLGFQVSQTVKNLPAIEETGFNPWVRKIPWRRKWQPVPVFLSGKFHGQRGVLQRDMT